MQDPKPEENAQLTPNEGQTPGLSASDRLEISSLKEKISIMEKQNVDYLEKMQHSTLELNRVLRLHEEEKASLLGRIKEYEDHLSILKEKLDSLEKENWEEAANRTKEESDRLRIEIEALNREKKDLLSRIGEFERNIVALESHKEHLSDTIGNLKSENKDNETAIDSLKGVIEKLETENKGKQETIQTNEKVIEEMGATVKHLNTLIEELRQKISVDNEEKALLEQTIVVNRKDIDRLGSVCKKQVIEIEELKEECAKMTELWKRTADSEKELMIKLEKANKELEQVPELQDIIKKKDDKINGLNTVLGEKNKEIVQLQQKITNLEEQRKDAEVTHKEEIDKLNTELRKKDLVINSYKRNEQEHLEEIKIKSKAIVDLEASLNKIKSDLREREEIIKDLDAKYIYVQEQLKYKDVEITKVSKQNEDLMEENRNIVSKYKSLVKKYQAEKLKLDELRHKIDAKEQAIAQKEAQIAKKEADLQKELANVQMKDEIIVKLDKKLKNIDKTNEKKIKALSDELESLHLQYKEEKQVYEEEIKALHEMLKNTTRMYEMKIQETKRLKQVSQSQKSFILNSKLSMFYPYNNVQSLPEHKQLLKSGLKMGGAAQLRNTLNLPPIIKTVKIIEPQNKENTKSFRINDRKSTNKHTPVKKSQYTQPHSTEGSNQSGQSNELSVISRADLDKKSRISSPATTFRDMDMGEKMDGYENGEEPSFIKDSEDGYVSEGQEDEENNEDGSYQEEDDQEGYDQSNTEEQVVEVAH